MRKKRRQDLISNLPQDIICRILSFLPTKDAVQTSVLSKRWIHHWTSVTSFDITDMELNDNEKKSIRFLLIYKAKRRIFIRFINRLLRSLSNPSIYSVKLRLTYASHGHGYEEKLIDAWIDSILRRRVQKLEIICQHSFVYQFTVCPSSIFHCSSLVELNLTLTSFVANPFVHCLPNLQFLKLGHIYFRIPSSLNFVSSFPALKVFEIISCLWLGGEENEKNDIVINAPLLERFLLEEGLTTSPLGTFKINAPNLRSIAYIDVVANNIIVSNPLSVVHGTVQVNFASSDFTTFPFLTGFSNFKRLLCLKLDVHSCLPQDTLWNLLHKLPILEKLELRSLVPYKFSVLLHDFVHTLKEASQVPRCFLSSFKFVEMHFNCKYKCKCMDEILKEVKELKKLIPSAPTIKIYTFGDEQFTSLLCSA